MEKKIEKFQNIILFVDMIKSYHALLTFYSNYSTKNAFVFVYTSLKKFYESSPSSFQFDRQILKYMTKCDVYRQGALAKVSQKSQNMDL